MKKLFLTLISVAIIGQISAGDLVPADTFDYKPYLKAAALPLAGAVGTTILATSCLAVAAVSRDCGDRNLVRNFCYMLRNKEHLKRGAASGQYGLAAGAAAGTAWGLKRYITNKKQGAGILGATFISTGALYFALQAIRRQPTSRLVTIHTGEPTPLGHGSSLGTSRSTREIVSEHGTSGQTAVALLTETQTYQEGSVLVHVPTGDGSYSFHIIDTLPQTADGSSLTASAPPAVEDPNRPGEYILINEQATVGTHGTPATGEISEYPQGPIEDHFVLDEYGNPIPDGQGYYLVDNRFNNGASYY